MINQYVLIILWLGLMGVISKNFYTLYYDRINDEYDWRVNIVFAIIVFAPIIWMAASRTNFADTYNYKMSFLRMPDSFEEIRSYIINQPKDRGFYLLSCALKLFIGNDTFKYFLSMSILQSIILIKLYKKYSIDYVMSVFLFVASTECYSWMFNGMRQFTAIVVVLLSTTLLMKKKYIYVVAIILIASTIHQSALIMIPIVFIVQGKAWNKKTIMLIIAVILAITFVGNFTSLLNDSLENTQYSGTLQYAMESGDDGANPIRALVYSIPALIAFFNREKIKEKNNQIINILVNISIITAGLYWLSVFTSGIIIARLTGYTSLYGYILLPWEVQYCFEREKSTIVRYGMIIGFVLYYIYQTHFAWGLI